MTLNKNLIIGILLSIIIIIFLVLAFFYVKDLGMKEASVQISNQIIYDLTTNGYLVVYVPYNNQTIPIKLVPEKT